MNDFNFDFKNNINRNVEVSLDKLAIIDAKKIFDNHWISSDVQTDTLIDLLEETNVNQSDIVVLYLYTKGMIDRVSTSEMKGVIKQLKDIITITKKEETDCLKYGVKNSKHRGKIVKRIIKAYFTPASKLKGALSKNEISQIPGLTGKDFITTAVDALLELNSSTEKMSNELVKAQEKKMHNIIVFNFMQAIYRDDEEILSFIDVLSHTLDGETLINTKNYFFQECALIYRVLIGEVESHKRSFDNFMMDTVHNIVENENKNMQDERAFYTGQLAEAIENALKLEAENEKLKQELEFYKELFKNRLKDKKILLIGDKKKESEYIDSITKMGGKMDMVDSFEDFSKITTSMLDNYDAIILFTYYTSHSVSKKLNKYSNKTHLVNSSSRGELEKVLYQI